MRSATDMAMSLKSLPSRKNTVPVNKMNVSFVLVGCDYNMTSFVAEKLKHIPIVSDVQETAGMYDIVATIKSDSADMVKSTIANKIRLIEGIRTTLTLFGNKSA